MLSREENELLSTSKPNAGGEMSGYTPVGFSENVMARQSDRVRLLGEDLSFSRWQRQSGRLRPALLASRNFLNSAESRTLDPLLLSWLAL
jgi:hypothetical protein